MLSQNSGWSARARKLLATAVIGAASVTGMTAGMIAQAHADTSFLNVSYDPTRELYQDFNQAFGKKWKAETGETVTFKQSHGGSGGQARSVLDGLQADVVTLALAYDIDALAAKGLVAQDWQKRLPDNASPYTSTIVFLVRKGNPKQIKGWSDLVRPGISVLTPNPFSSGSAKWNLLAAYGAELKLGKSPAQALAYLNQLISHNVKAQDKSASAALSDFTSGNGDVLLSYESDAIAAEKKGEPVTYVVPDQTILIQEPAAVLTKSSHATQAQAFLKFLWTDQGQAIFAKNGYRPVVPSVLKQYDSVFPTPKQLFKISDLGGWTVADKQFFDPQNGSIAKIESGAGVSTAK
jgi:sulfate/thiosulfate-binding protein